MTRFLKNFKFPQSFRYKEAADKEKLIIYTSFEDLDFYVLASLHQYVERFVLIQVSIINF